jgi:hypothetical protein
VLPKTILLVTLLIYGIPLWGMRYQWRSTIYRVTDWKINIMPWFGRDIAALLTNRYFVNDAECRMARRYRAYLLVYSGLLVLMICLP